MPTCKKHHVEYATYGECNECYNDPEWRLTMDREVLPLRFAASLWDDERKVLRKHICDHCHGTGRVRDGGTHEVGCECQKCLGSGRKQKPIVCDHCEYVNLTPQINKSMPKFSPPIFRFRHPLSYKCESCGKNLFTSSNLPQHQIL